MEQENNAMPPSIDTITAERAVSTEKIWISVGKLLISAWRDYTERWKLFVGIALVPICAYAVFVALTTVGLLPWLLSMILVILGIIITGILLTLSTISVIYAAAEKDKTGDIVYFYRKAFGKLISFWWVSLLVGFVTIGGLFLFIVPGIVLAVWFTFATYAVLLEDQRGMNALLRSRAYVHGNFLPIFWRLFFIAAVVTVILLPTAALQEFLQPLLISHIIGIVIIAIIAALVSPISILYSYRLYQNARDIKGEFVFSPSGKIKTAVLLVGVLGIVALPLLFIYLGWLLERAGEEEFAQPYTNLLQLDDETFTLNRDIQRRSDIRKLHDAIFFYLIEAGNPDLDMKGNRCVDEFAKTIFVSLESAAGLPVLPDGWNWRVSPTPKNIDGTGWIPIDFTKTPFGSPISELPVDPVNRADLPRGERLFYTYVCHAGTMRFAINANMESERFSKGGDGDAESTDEGKWPYVYEIGTNPDLSPGWESDIYFLP
jgi:hypothetical protein